MKKTKDRTEIKGKVTSVRLTEEQHKTIQKKADAAGMTVSNFMITAAMNNNAATPAMIVKMQDIVNYACSVIDETKQDMRVILQERMNQLWQKLK